MKRVLIPVIIVIVVGVRIAFRLRSKHVAERDPASKGSARPRPNRRISMERFEDFFGEMGLVALREVRVRTRGKIFRIGTLIILAAVAAGIIIPVLHSGKATPQKVGVVGTLSPELRKAVLEISATIYAPVRIVEEPSTRRAQSDLRSGHISLAIIDSKKLLTYKQVIAGDGSSTASLAHAVSSVITLQTAFQDAKITPAQAAALAQSKPTPIGSLVPATSHGSERATALYGLILVFVLLQQYSAWTLIGVAEEKSSRVVEVLLAAVRPVQLLGGKVAGIGVVALAQAGIIVAFALVLAKAVGSNLFHGAAPLGIVSALVWLMLGYAFYAWVYAAAGSLAERQDQLQTLTFPLSIPIILGYIVSLLVAVSGTTTVLFDVLAYLPPTAPFAMPVMVGLGQATWWEFSASVLLSIGGTILIAKLAAKVYERAILRTGGRVHLREVTSRTSG